MWEFANYVAMALGWTLGLLMIIAGVLFLAYVGVCQLRRFLHRIRRPWQKLTADRYRHIRRGTAYVRVGMGHIQCSAPVNDMDLLIAYRDEQTGTWWFRPPGEFEDINRFEYEGKAR